MITRAQALPALCKDYKGSYLPGTRVSVLWPSAVDGDMTEKEGVIKDLRLKKDRGARTKSNIRSITVGFVSTKGQPYEMDIEPRQVHRVLSVPRSA